MTDEYYRKIMEAFDRRMNEELTPEQALSKFVRAGIMDEEGNFREPYKDLEWYFANTEIQW
ncbi:hypothetical protein HHL16_06910 [Pseudoflavitalea sp. G-6-1-2]|uniref:hypothetical protein n=1 Tax=Pseudoflavitalea sp. G-6-1-2 TaxID=2728841 RepID=UPI00146E44E3|nr:hypothetical protein [Pseudoflavitalea sp. G-6-1-2]NML20596.1 hypothetical protein [Pseudoflavitalea sp. G-6-1-2]